MAQRRISIETPLKERLLIRAATVTEHLGQPFQIEIDLLSPDERIDFDLVLGKEVRLDVVLGDGGTRHFHAFVAHFSQSGRLGRSVTYHARAVPWLWFLTRTTDCRIFQNRHVPDIVKEIFREHGFTDVKDSLSKSYRVRDYCVQYCETDFNFIQRLLEEEGIYYYFHHHAAGHRLVLADGYGGHSISKGYETVDYFPPSDNAQRERDHVHAWHVSRQIQSGKYVSTDYDFTKPRSSLQVQTAQARGAARTDYEVFDYPGKHLTTSEGDHYAQARLEALQACYETSRALGNTRGLGVGHLFTLGRYPREDQNREYLIVGAVHRLDAGEYESGVASRAADYSCSLEVIDAKQPFRCAPSAVKTRVNGPQTAMVVGPAGEEIHTDEYGRVKVQFHWDRYGRHDDASSCWVRVSQIWAGKNWGWMSIPRIGQEVLVDFLEGDPDQPLITGRLYNQDNMPPFDLPAHKTQSGIRTRSSKDGGTEQFNEIRFEDKSGEEQLYVHAERNMDSVVEKDDTQQVGGDRSIAVKGYHHEEVTKEIQIQSVEGHVFVKAATSITLQVGKSSLTMYEDGSIAINGVQIETTASREQVIKGGKVNINP